MVALRAEVPDGTQDVRLPRIPASRHLLLSAEAASDEPGQDAVLARLLDLVFVIALRAWCTRPEAPPPAWYRALTDPAIGEALRLMHEDPAHRPRTHALGVARLLLTSRTAGAYCSPSNMLIFEGGNRRHASSLYTV
ncbi:cupin domain-containing protein [Nonomuraea sp. NPDC026600]|uniref:cupin domain-containing protein n=1 Tax=Nonomuraea sp. NPDC026600 TaxID=3155363 RepID=UPI0033EDB682